MTTLPAHFEAFTDTYFLRSLKILQEEHLNPFVRTQLFIRQGPGKLGGMQEALSIIKKYSPHLLQNGGRVLSLLDGDQYESEETIMILEARIQDIIALETMMLGVISAETTIVNDGNTVDLNEIEKRVSHIVSLIGDRPLVYFGARHWRYDLDEAIAKAAFSGGAVNASTDAGARTAGKKGVGTIPHSLQCIFAWKYGYENAVVQSLKAFDRHIEQEVPRVALVDFRNHEIDDSLAARRILGEKLQAVRVDTCGENYMQGMEKTESNDKRAYWTESGVSILGVSLLRQALDAAGFSHLKIMLTSGFGEVAKVRAFVEAEKELGIKLFDSLGVGNLFHARAVTMDIVGVGETIDAFVPISKKGRGYKTNDRLRLVTS